MRYQAFVMAFALSLAACAASRNPVSVNQDVRVSPAEFRLSMAAGRPGEQTGEWLKAVCQAPSKTDETCVSYMWGTLDALTRWPPRDNDGKPFCISGLSYGTIADGVRGYVSSVSDEDAGRTDAATLIRRAAISRFPC
jgi:hypothetical protein